MNETLCAYCENRIYDKSDEHFDTTLCRKYKRLVNLRGWCGSFEEMKDPCKDCSKLLEKPACLEALYSYNCIREDPFEFRIKSKEDSG